MGEWNGEGYQKTQTYIHKISKSSWCKVQSSDCKRKHVIIFKEIEERNVNRRTECLLK